LTPSGSAKTIIGQRGWACPTPASGLRCGPCEKKWIYGKTREEVHAKWIKLQEGGRARSGRNEDAKRRGVLGLLAP
jgi:hypothetical protein